MKKTYSVLIVCIFVLFLAAVSVGSLVAPERTFSQMENRVLKTAPKLTEEAVMDGSYMNDAETYLSDHILLRDFWFCVNAGLNRTLGRTDANGVYFGRDGALLERETTPDPADLLKRVGYVNTLSEKTDLPIYFGLIPSASTVWRDRLPANAETAREDEVIAQAYDACKVKTIDVLGALNDHRDEPIYFRTDHHWTPLGARYAADALLTAMDLEPLDESELDRETVSDSFYGTLYSKTGAFWLKPDAVERFVTDEGVSVTQYSTMKPEPGQLYHPELLAQKNQYNYFLGGNKPIVILNSENAPAGKVLVVRDSYCDVLAPFLTRRFSEVHLFDMRYNSLSLVSYAAEHDIDAIVILYGYSTFINDTSVFRIGK